MTFKSTALLLTSVLATTAQASTHDQSIKLKVEVKIEGEQEVKTTVTAPLNETTTVANFESQAKRPLSIHITPELVKGGDAKVSLSVLQGERVVTKPTLVLSMGSYATTKSAMSDGRKVEVTVLATQPESNLKTE